MLTTSICAAAKVYAEPAVTSAKRGSLKKCANADKKCEESIDNCLKIVIIQTQQLYFFIHIGKEVGYDIKKIKMGSK